MDKQDRALWERIDGHLERIAFSLERMVHENEERTRKRRERQEAVRTARHLAMTTPGVVTFSPSGRPVAEGREIEVLTSTTR